MESDLVKVESDLAKVESDPVKVESNPTKLESDPVKLDQTPLIQDRTPLFRGWGEGGGRSPPFTNFYISRLREMFDISKYGFFGVLNQFPMSVW